MLHRHRVKLVLLTLLRLAVILQCVWPQQLYSLSIVYTCMQLLHSPQSADKAVTQHFLHSILASLSPAYSSMQHSAMHAVSEKL